MKVSKLFTKSSDEPLPTITGNFAKANKKQVTLIITDHKLYQRSSSGLKEVLLTGLRFAIRHKFVVSLVIENDVASKEFIFLNSQPAAFWEESLSKLIPMMDFTQYFQQEKLIGQGTFASVYQVTRKTDGKVFAAKAFLKKQLFSKDQNARVSIENEIRVLRILNHPNVLRLYGVFENRAQIQLVTDLARGGTLEDALRKLEAPLPFLCVKVIFNQILNGIKHMHEQGTQYIYLGYMHRDLKPANIIFRRMQPLKKYGLIQEQPNVLISDFGIASKITSLDIYSFCGSFGFMAPEVIECENKVTQYNEKCDIFSLGCILYQLIANKPLFPNKEANRDMLINWVNISKDCYGNRPLLNTLQRMLARDPKLRPSCQEILSSEIFHVDYEQDGCPVFKDYQRPSLVMSTSRASLKQKTVPVYLNKQQQQQSFRIKRTLPPLHRTESTIHY